jgi:hypothetical protein
VIARVKGVEYQAPKVEKSAGRTWSEMSSATAISLGLLAILLSVLSLIFRDERPRAAVAAMLGTGAIAIEISFHDDRRADPDRDPLCGGEHHRLVLTLFGLDGPGRAAAGTIATALNSL